MKIKIKLESAWLSLIEKCCDITGIQYLEGEEVELEDLLQIIDDLVDKIEITEEQNENEERITDLYEYYGVSREDFC